MESLTVEVINGYKVTKTTATIPEGVQCLEQWWYPMEESKQTRRKVEVYKWIPDLEHWLNLDSDTKKKPESEQPYRVMRWLNGKKHGLEETFDTKGRKLLSLPWKNGLKDGTEERWTEDEEGPEQKLIYWKSDIGRWVDGKQHGLEEGFWYNGNPSKKVMWENGLQHGPADYYFLNNENHLLSTWENGIRVKYEFFSVHQAKQK